MKPDGNMNGPWELHGYSDADYTGDNYTRKSVTGCIVLINGAITAGSFQIHKTVRRSVIEDEYSAITEVFFEILFVRAILLLVGFLSNSPLPYTLITLDIYSYQRTYLYPNK